MSAAVGKRGVDVAAADNVRLEQVVVAPDHSLRVQRCVDGEYRLERLDLEADQAARFLDQVLVGMGEEKDRLLGVIDALVGEIGLVVEDQGDDIPSGDVGGGDDRDLVPGDARLVDDVAKDAARRPGCAR